MILDLPLGIDITQIFLHLLNVAILFTGLYILLYSPVVKFMKAREDKYKQMDDDANMKLADAEKLKEEYTQKIDAVESEISERKKAASAEINAMKEQAERQAKEQASRIVDDAKKEAESQKKHIVTEAKEEISDMVKEATRKVVLTSNVSEAYDLFLDDAESDI